MVNQLMTVQDVARLLGQHPKTVLRAVGRGEIAHVRFGQRAIRFRPEDIEAFINSRRTGASV